MIAIKNIFRNRFAKDLIVYTLSSVILSLMSTVFRVWISNKVGSEGMGLYSLVYSVYLPACTLAVSCVNIASTRLVTEAVAKNKTGTIRGIITRCFIYSALFGSLSCALVWFFAEPISLYWIEDPAAIVPLRVICFGLPCLSIASGLHGAFTALRKISKSIIVQVTEDVTKILVMFFLVTVFYGDRLSDNIVNGVVSLVAGSAAGETVSCIVAVILYSFEKRNFKPETVCTDGKITKKLLSISLPSAFSAYIRSGLAMFESLMVPVGFRKYGMTEPQALSVLGMFKGMVTPVIFFPATLIGSFSRLIVPEMAEAYEKQDRKKIEAVAVRSVKATLVFSFFVMCVFLFFADPLGKTLYSSTEASAYIRLLAPLVPLMYLDNVVDSLLKGLNGQVTTMKINIVDSIIRVLLVVFLLPKTGFDGYLFVTYISTLLNGTLSINRFLKISKIKVPVAEVIFFPLLSSFTAVLATFVFFMIVAPASPVFLKITVCALVYALIVWFDDIRNLLKKYLTKMPKSGRIATNIQAPSGK